MKLSNILTTNVIVTPLRSSNKKDVIGELLSVLDKMGFVTNKAQALEDILTRENHLSTGMENGLAVPHAKTDSVDKLVVAFGVHPAGIAFDSLDGKDAQLIFLVMSPRDTSGPHIQALASISRFLKNEEMRQKLIHAESKEAVYALLSESN
jgi:fructose-specific phosphotransferase system IIA component